MQRFIKIFSIAIVFLTTLPFTASAGTIPVSVHLTVVTYDTTLFDGDVAVSECLDTQTGTSTSVNALCALEQVASSSSWTLGTTWYPSFGIFLDSINGYTPDSVNSRYWGYYSNGNIGFDALNAHALSTGEHVLLTYGINPLRVVAATTTPLVGSSTTLTSQYFDPMLFDWAPATSTTFTIDTIATDSDAFGAFGFIPSTTTASVVIVSKAGYVSSLPITLFPYQIIATTTTETASTTPTPPGGSATPDATHTIDTTKAVGFLRAHAGTDGAYSAPLYTDWVAIGLSGVSEGDDMRVKLSSYMLTHTDPGTTLTDLERRAMALEALSIDPSTGTSRDYIKEVRAGFDGTQFGDKNEINDDIFALIVLQHAGYGASDEVISKTVATIIGAQGSDGSWGSIDLTAAAIMALTPLNALPSVVDAISKAKVHLHTAQGTDGGFGSSFATSWVLQAIVSMQNQHLSSDWMKNGKTPQDYLWLLQQVDGGVEPTTLADDSRIWATAYAIPAASGKDWNTLLGAFPRHESVTPASFGSTVSGNDGEVLGASTSTASTTITTSTSTLVILPFVLANPKPTMASSSVVATGTEVKKPATLHKKNIPAKKVTTLTPIALTSTTILASTTREETVIQASWKHVVTAPFQRLYQALTSWFH